MADPRNREGITALFRSCDSDRIRSFILGCPDFPLREEAATLAGSSAPGAQALALGMVAQGFAFGRNPDLGAEVAMAAHDISRDAFDEHGPQVILPVTLSRCACEALAALNTSGRYEDALRAAEEFIALYGDDPDNGSTIRVAKITSLVELNRIGEARAEIEDEEVRGVSGPAAIEFDRLKRVVMERMNGSATQLRRDREPTQASDELAAENERLRRVLDAGTEFLTGSTGELNEWTAMQLIRDGTAIFTHPTRGRDPKLIRDSIEKLVMARRWARENESIQHENDALWGLYLCWSRLEEPSTAGEMLQALRANIESARSTIADPIERAGIGGSYPHLFPVLCHMLALADRTEDLLDAMEGAKGRAVADLITHRQGRPIADHDLQAPAEKLIAGVVGAEVHYVSFFVDDDWTHAVLVDKQGNLHRNDEIPIGKERIRELCKYADPRLWGKPDKNDPLGAVAPDVSDALSPLLSWIQSHLERGTIAEGDHIVYSPDEHLHHIPLHYLKVADEPLVRWVSVSRTHGAHALMLMLENPPVRPDKAFSIEVSLGEDSDDTRTALHAVPEWLSQHYPGEALASGEATIAAVLSNDLTNRVLHFATHGVFPSEGAAERAPNPFESSGLVLAGRDGLPESRDLGGAVPDELLLSPRRVLDSELEMLRSHVSLQACVSGLAKEGIGGDALGLDWALTQAGSASLLTSHWDVSASLSAEFFTRFYQRWLIEHQTRAEAWRRTVLELISSPAPLNDPYTWAAFSLSGDWR